ncbi:Serine/threonine-protein kinase Pkn1 [Thermoflexales bacterium]|nr:Serine/threonine-protein kinase Pkn1 [Thermoflexales bacterium]
MTDTSTCSLRIFLCHSFADKPAVRELYQRLQADGFEPWLDEEDLLPGQDWQREIPKAVRNSDVVIVCLSKGSITKAGYVHKEIKFALDVADEQPEDAVFLIPLKLEECDVPDRLSLWHAVSLFRVDGYERLLKALRLRAASLNALDASAPAASPPASSPAGPSSSVSNVSGGVNIGGDAQVGNDVVGRDKVIRATTYIEHATFIQSTAPVPVGQADRSREEASASDVQTWGGVEFVRIPAGKFLMGSREDNPLASDSEKPRHSIEIAYDYWLARYPVTNEQFVRFVEATARKIDLDKNWSNKADHPVVNVTWREALEYCNWLQTLLGRDLPATAGRVRLPTEAEWEKAARGDLSHAADRGDPEEAREWPWGNEFDKAKCNSEEGGRKSTTPVGAYSPQGDSLSGLADMVGNVWEWTVSLWGLDLFQPQYRYPYQPNDGREKLDAPPAVYRVVRGGAFNSRQGSVRVAYRYWFDSRARSDSVGFRVAVAPRLF